MGDKIAVIGFGEAGQAFSEGWGFGPERLRVYDIAIHNQEQAPGMYAAFAARSVTGTQTPAEAVDGAGIVFCLVPTDQAVAAAKQIASYLDPGAIWVDGSSSAPGTKLQVAEIIHAGNGHYVDMAIMAPVHPKRHQTPVLLSGDFAEKAHEIASSLGMISRVVGREVGDASTVKMLRSIMVKGIEALTAECFLAARRVGVDDLVFESLRASDTKTDWPERTTYNLGRMREHGVRRAAEMREVARTLGDLNMPNWMATSTALWQDKLAGPVFQEDVRDVSALLDQFLADFE